MIKKGDKVIVIAGKDKGKSGTVTQALPKMSKVVVGGINVSKRHKKARAAGAKGTIVEVSAPIHVSNLKLAK